MKGNSFSALKVVEMENGSSKKRALCIESCGNKKPREINLWVFKRLAATYSRGSYTTTTIGHAVFDGRVRDGNGSDHCGIATKIGVHGL